MAQHLTWQLVDELADTLGAGKPARLKWRQRGVPAEWQIRIFEALKSRGHVVDFVEFDMLIEQTAAA